jgi:hypothetical protein
MRNLFATLGARPVASPLDAIGTNGPTIVAE